MNECLKIRKKLELSQSSFAILLGVSAPSVRNWEQEVRTIPDMAKSLFFLLEADFLHEDNDRRVAIRLTQKACTKKYKNSEDVKKLDLLIRRFFANNDGGRMICYHHLFESNGIYFCGKKMSALLPISKF